MSKITDLDMNKSMKLCLSLAALPSLCIGQDAPNFPMKRLSEIKSEKERCAYIIALADAGKFQFGQSWSKIEPFFDVDKLTHEIDPNTKHVIVYLKDQHFQKKPQIIDGYPAASGFSGWYVVIELGGANIIRKFYLSNSHK